LAVRAPGAAPRAPGAPLLGAAEAGWGARGPPHRRARLQPEHRAVPGDGAGRVRVAAGAAFGYLV